MSTHRPTQLPSHEVLSKLARDDPEGFEALRSSLIENCIDGAPERIRHRLRQLQFRVDGIRRRSGSALGATVKIHALMWESFLEMNEQLQCFSRSRQGPQRSPLPAATRAPILRPAKDANVIELQPRLSIHDVLAESDDIVFAPEARRD